MARIVFVALVLVLGLTACQRRDPVLFDGLFFKTRVDAPRGDRRAFTVAVRDAARNLASAQRAGRYGGTVYCLDKFGGSEIEWAEAALVPADQLAPNADGALVLQGRCLVR